MGRASFAIRDTGRALLATIEVCHKSFKAILESDLMTVVR